MGHGGTSPTPKVTDIESKESGTTTTYVYPNPTASELHIHAGENLEIAGATLLSTDGLALRIWKGSLKKLDLKGILPGHYIIRIRCTDGTDISHSILLK